MVAGFRAKFIDGLWTHVDVGLAVPARLRIGGGGSLEWGLWYDKMKYMLRIYL